MRECIQTDAVEYVVELIHLNIIIILQYITHNADNIVYNSSFIGALSDARIYDI